METKACPICREIHGSDRGLSFDGKGVNSCGMYRERLATLQPDCPEALGRLFAEAPAMLALLERGHTLNNALDGFKSHEDFIILAGKLFEDCTALLAKIEGK